VSILSTKTKYCFHGDQSPQSKEGIHVCLNQRVGSLAATLQNAQNDLSRRVNIIKEKKTEDTTSTPDNTQTSFFTNTIVNFTGGLEGDLPKKVSGGHRAVHGLPFNAFSKEEEELYPPSRVYVSYSSTTDESAKATGYQTKSPTKITTSQDKGVEVSVGKRGKINVSDVSYFTDDSVQSTPLGS
jgi:hypothetical protein